MYNFPLNNNTIQTVVYVIIFGIGAVVLNFLYRFWTGYIQRWLEDEKDKFYEKEKKKKTINDAVIKILIEQCHYNLRRIVRRCQLKGYRDDHDREDFMRILDLYHEIGGNTDSGLIEKDFGDIKPAPTFTIPLEIGSSLPNKELLKNMLDVYNGINNEKLSKTTLNHIKSVLFDLGVLPEDLGNDNSLKNK